MVLEAATPAIGSIGLADFAGCDEGVVALVADVVVAVVADVTVVSGVAGRNWIVADVAVLLDRDYDVAVLWQVRKGDSADRKSTRLNSSHSGESRMPSSA